MEPNQQLQSLSSMDEGVRQQVINVYRGLAHNFRERMDSKIVGIDWTMHKIRNRLFKYVKEIYGTGKSADSVILEKLMQSKSKYIVEFEKCICEEKLFVVRRRRTRTSNSAANLSGARACANIVNARTSSVAINLALPNSRIMEVPLISQFQSLDNDYQKLKQCEELVNCNAVVKAQAFEVLNEWKVTSNRMLQTACYILQSVKEFLCQWDLRKRRLSNLLNHNDERFDPEKNFDRDLFDQVDAVYTHEINAIERYAQAAVKRLYDVSDSADFWLTRFHDFAVKYVADEARGLIIEFATNTFIVWRQSDQELRSNNKFKATVRLLVGPVLRLADEIDVDVTMLTSEQIKTALASNEFCSTSPEAIEVKSNPTNVCLENVPRSNKYDTKVMLTGQKGRKKRCVQPSGEAEQQSMIAEFADITWKSNEKRNSHDKSLVSQWKYAAVFQSSVNLFGYPVTVKLCCWSLPLVLTVHPSQKCLAHGTVFWDNAFSALQREPFCVPDEVSWHEFYPEFLKWFCVKTQSTRYQLAQHNQEFIFKCLAQPNSAGNGYKVTLHRLLSELLDSPIKFRFWDWIYGICTMIRKEKLLQFLWSHDAVYGFATHESAAKKLQHSDRMLLRFSTKPVERKEVDKNAVKAKAADNNKGPERLVGLVIMITLRSRRFGLVVSSLWPATMDDMSGEADLRARLLSPPMSNKEIYGIDTWQKQLLPEYDRQTNFDDTALSGHYIKVEFAVLLREGQSTSFPDSVDENMSPIVGMDLDTRSIDSLDILNDLSSLNEQPGSKNFDSYADN